MSGLFGGSPKVQQPQAAAAITIQQSAYGTPVYLLYGTNRIYGNLLWYGAFNAVLVSTGAGGGKGGVVGGGGKGGGSSEYNYSASFAIGLCEGPISGIGEVYVSKQTTNLATLFGVLFNGAQGQEPWGYLTTNFPGAARGYTELCYVGFPNFGLGSSSETPQFSFETFGLKVIGGGNQDCSVDQFFIDFLTRCGIPAGNIGTFATLKNYCTAMGFFISPLLDQQRTALDWLNEIMATLNAEFVWSNGVLDAVPYADTPVSGNGVNFVPNLSPVYSIGDDAFIRDGDVDPVTGTRKDLADAYNQAPIEYVNRSDQYNVETYQAFDDALVDAFGFRTAPTMRAHHVTDPYMAQQMAQLWMNRQIYRRTTYEFKLPWNYILPDPMDLLGITDVNLGLSDALVQIVSIEEDEKTGALSFTTEEVPGAIAGPTLYPNQGAVRATPNYNLAPGNVNAPVIFEPPLGLIQAAQVEVDMAISGSGEFWGGCDIWVSTDGVTYQFLSQFNNASRMGATTADLPNYSPSASGPIDNTNVLYIDMTESKGSLNNAATHGDAIALNTACFVGGEFIAYGADSLISGNKYQLSYLNRGCYGSTISDHPAGTPFARYDAGIFRYVADQSRLGQTLYFKFLSFNVWGGGMQTLDEVSPYTYKVTGAALLQALANVSNLAVSYTADVAILNWTPISDLRAPIYYEIRKGTTYATAQVIGSTTETTFPVYGADTYWVTALYFTPAGVPVYSASGVSIVVTAPAITNFSLGSHAEDPLWTGALGGGASIVSSTIELLSGNILSLPNIFPIPNILDYATVAASGSYTAPSGHTITSTYIAPGKAIVNWTVGAANITTDVPSMPDVTAVTDMVGATPAQITAIPQIAISQDGGSTWSAWQNWVPGVYPGNAWKFQILLASLDPNVTPVLSAFSYEVDVPSLTQSGTATTSASGPVAVAYPNEFNAVAAPVCTIQNKQAGDVEVITSITASGFNIEVLNSGSPVVRTVSYSATAY